ncbi:porin [Leptospira ellisii]|uniref:Porin n=3 Tax=Leptospira ellisii TaxID=2023197 RepID=A0AAE4QLX7_9LEPT|nr:porin [Leptospira ellisii]MDV6235452.1 porin [Leptospira ellisii]
MPPEKITFRFQSEMKVKKKKRKSPVESGWVRISVIGVLFAFGTGLWSQEKQNSDPQAQENTKKEFYEDNETGLIYTKPGPNRTKIDPIGRENFPERKEMQLPNHFRHRPDKLNEEKLVIAARTQFRGVSGSKESPFSGNEDFNTVDANFRRLRLGFFYQGAKWWGFATQLRLENALNSQFLKVTKDKTSGDVKDVTLNDSRGLIHEAVVWLNIPFMSSRFTVGQINVPFNREYIQSSANFVFLERSLITNVLPQFDIGAMIAFHPLELIDKKYTRHLSVHAFIGNGHGGGGDYGYGRRQDNTATRQNLPQLLAPVYYGRIQYNVFGGLVKGDKDIGWVEGDEIFQNETKLSFGAGLAQTTQVKTAQPIPLEYLYKNQTAPKLILQQTTPTGGSDPTGLHSDYLADRSVTTPGRPNLGIVGHTYDMTFTWKGFYLNGAWSKFSGSAANQVTGYHGTIGYNIHLYESKYVMPVFKFEFVKGDWNQNQIFDPGEAYYIYWAGINLLGDYHLYKVQLFYQQMHTNSAKHFFLNTTDNRDSRAVYLQFQANFWTGTSSPENVSGGAIYRQDY